MDSLNVNVSVIIPCYNCEKYIIRAIKSLEIQTYKNFEVIIVNDGSTDSSDEIIKSYLKDTNLKYKYFYQENSGVSKSRNKGIDNANGKYITFLDSDDLYHKDFLQSLVSLIESNDVDTVYCSYTRDISTIINETVTDENSIDILNHNELMNNFMYRKGPCGFFNYIYKNSIVNDFNIRFDERTRYGEDLEFTWKYLIHCKSAVFLNRNLYGYYDNPQSAVNNVSWNITDVIHAIKRVERYMAENNDSFLGQFKLYMYDRTIWAVLKDFAVHDKKEMFEKLIKTYQVKKAMKNMVLRGPHILIKISAILFLINEKLFYNIIKKI